MNAAQEASPPAPLGYAVGMGLALVPIAGLPLRFAFVELSPWIVYGATFAAGLVIGLVLATRRRRAER